MNTQMISDLLKRLGRLEERCVTHRQGVVTAVAPLAVAVGGSTTSMTNARAISDAPLVIGEVVSVATFANDLIVLGGVAAPDTVHLVGGAGEPAFANGWSNYAAGRAAASYYRAHGRVHLCGLVKSGTVGAAIFTLPSGYRPLAGEVFATAAGGSYGELVVEASGQVFLASGLNAYVGLSGHSFRCVA